MSDNDNRTTLLQQANELGLSFKSNIPTTKLQSLIEASLNIVVPDESSIASITAPVEDAPVTIPDGPILNSKKRIAKLKADAFRTKVVTITNKDVREADVATTVHLGFENDFFGLAKNVPLDVPVELEVSLIKIANSVKMTLHKDEILLGKRTGNKVAVSVSKYAISYGEE